MRDLKTYLSVAPVVSTLWFGALAGLLIEINHIRVRVILECTCCAQKSVNKESTGISRYITQKNRHNTPSRLELRKFCSCCCKHTIHAEIKK
ncbi:hypothetical protein Ahy_A03g011449 [Arachis hypogaea]|uniref:Large ribosomal subunit protein bL33c n=1 Tax=Arachis hypogaea TaxID=3818 RepID=A0A445DQS1_ARAHY|nr:hypothetical protein Ahy_A03g011449 [Arachis hypogaea]